MVRRPFASAQSVAVQKRRSNFDVANWERIRQCVVWPRIYAMAAQFNARKNGGRNHFIYKWFKWKKKYENEIICMKKRTALPTECCAVGPSKTLWPPSTLACHLQTLNVTSINIFHYSKSTPPYEVISIAGRGFVQLYFYTVIPYHLQLTPPPRFNLIISPPTKS